MASAARAVVCANGVVFPGGHRLRRSVRVRSTAAQDPDCNADECAPEKEVGKVSVEWLAEEKTRVVGTYPPRKKSWTGYVEKDTAGQTNIYSVEPAVYVAESAISSGSAGTSSSGAENTAAVVGGLALIAVAAAASILIQVGKNAPPPSVTVQYSGPPLSYYVSKFKPPAPPAPPVVAEEPAPAPATEEPPAAEAAVATAAEDPAATGESTPVAALEEATQKTASDSRDSS